MIFRVGGEYTRPQLFSLVKLDPLPTGGNWFTGYARHNEEFYLFANVGVPGRTGHDYGNRWEGDRLRWYGKTGTNINQPLICQMIDLAAKVHVFWRSDNTQAFKYAGLGFAIEVKNTSPVEVLWAFR